MNPVEPLPAGNHLDAVRFGSRLLRPLSTFWAARHTRDSHFPAQYFSCVFFPGYISLLVMNREWVIQRRDRLLARLPEAREILRGSPLERTIRHRTGCLKCARGDGHPVAVLDVGYPGGVIRQISLPHEQVRHVRTCLANYRKLKAAIEKICQLNRQLLRSEKAETKTRRPR